jgi:hypothetical protein
MADPRSSKEQLRSEAYQTGTIFQPSRETRQTSEQGAGATGHAQETVSSMDREFAWHTGQARQPVRESASEMAGQQGRDELNENYGASKGMNETWDQAMEYSKDHPVTTALIAFGAGIGVGLFIVASFGGFQSRSRSHRLVPPILNLISVLSKELFR